MRLPTLLLTSTLLACGPQSRTGGDGGGGGGRDGGGSGPDADTGVCQAMDVVFIVDDSGSMAEEQANLSASFPQFAQLLMEYEVDGTPLDFQVAVTSSGRDVDYVIDNMGLQIPMSEDGDNGEFLRCNGGGPRWLSRATPNLATEFSCRAEVGTDGPGFEMPLLMSMTALRERVTDGTNAGFLREDALLAVVYLTDEDDCSRTDNNWVLGFGTDACTQAGAPHVLPDDVIEFFDTLKGGRGRWAATVIAAPDDCMSDLGDAAEAVKMKQFISQMNMGGPQNGIFASICEGNLAASLRTALDTFQAACESFPPIE